MNIINTSLVFIFTFLIAQLSFASSCSVDLEGNNMMQFSSTSIQIDSSCSKFTIKFKNTSNLDKEIAGHNVVVSKSSDFDELTNLVDPSNGMNEGFLPSNSKVIAKTPFLGPNESYDLVIDVSRLNSGDNYVFWCSFPGHWGIMKGDLNL
tara:strand:- start:189947 stop:190396 length:450 start_codon:yes stop_codon:yes gene_type:complete